MEQIPSYNIQADTQMHAKLCNVLFLASTVNTHKKSVGLYLQNLSKRPEVWIIC